MRGYVIDFAGNKKYTSESGNIVAMEQPLYAYYDQTEALADSGSGTQIAAVPLVPIVIFI